MELTLDDAKTIAIALNVYNQKLVDENEKIRNTPEVSELIVMAAQKQYQELTEAGTKLHVRLAEAFPELVQGH